jgi:hypothetical protein
MNGLLRRLKSRRAAIADEPPSEAPAASEPVGATVVSHEEEGPALSEEERAREDELRRRRRDLPAGLDADRLEASPGEGARRGAVRRRIRYLTAAREVLLRDLGGFAYEVHRAAGAAHGGHRDIIEKKAGRLAAIDGELRALEARLGTTSPAGTVVRQPGIGGTCPSCGELHGSDAGWCWHCGTPLSERAQKETHPATAERPAPGVVDRIRGALGGKHAGESSEEERPSDEQRRALEAYTGRTAEQRAPTGEPASGDPPTSDLGEPVSSERRP